LTGARLVPTFWDAVRKSMELDLESATPGYVPGGDGITP
jgi:hypothetical protein